MWLYSRYTLSYRDVEELLAARSIEVSYETIRRWVARFGPQIANRLRRSRPRAHPLWHLDEMFTSFGGRRIYLGRAIDQDGEVLDPRGPAGIPEIRLPTLFGKPRASELHP